MIEYLLIVDFTQKELIDKIFLLNSQNFPKEDLIKKSQENCKDESSRYTEVFESKKQILFAIKDKFGNLFIIITDNSTGKNGFVFDLLLQLEDVLNANDLEISKEANSFKNAAFKIVEEYNKKVKVEIIHDISSVSNLNKSKKTNVLDNMENDLENPNNVQLVNINDNQTGLGLFENVDKLTIGILVVGTFLIFYIVVLENIYYDKN